MFCLATHPWSKSRAVYHKFSKCQINIYFSTYKKAITQNINRKNYKPKTKQQISQSLISYLRLESCGELFLFFFLFFCFCILYHFSPLISYLWHADFFSSLFYLFCFSFTFIFRGRGADI